MSITINNKYKNFQKSPYMKKLETEREQKLISKYKQFDKKKIILGILDYHTKEELHEFLDECIYCGESRKEKLGLDRIDNSLGHTKENVLPCCRICNMVRGNRFTVDEMKKIGIVIKEIKGE